jgi:phage terminase large subunit-like protein
VTAPRYATERDPAAPSDGKRIAALAKALGKPLMPWQQQVVDVATEHEPDGTYRYEMVLVTVPRQSGKTTLVGPVQLDRILMNDGVKVFYTAQTGKDARSRFNDLVKLMQASPLDAFARYRYAAGSEAITIGGSSLHIFAPVAAALHGETPPLVTLDEIWEWDEATGDAILEGAIIPAQVTLAGRRQVWMISTAGSAAVGVHAEVGGPGPGGLAADGVLRVVPGRRGRPVRPGGARAVPSRGRPHRHDR